MKKIYQAVTIFMFLCFLGSQINFTKAISPGVSPGNEFFYDIKYIWNSTNQSIIIPEQVLDLNNTDFYKITITEIEDKNVLFQTLWRFFNGTEIEGTGTINLETGIAGFGDFWAIIGGNLNSGERIHPIYPDYVFINQTQVRNYGSGGNRETNLVDLTFTYVDPDDPSRYYVEYSQTYFDKQTGMLVELVDTTVYTNPAGTEKLTWKIKETNIWVVPEFPSVLIISLLMISSLIGAIYYKKKNKINTQQMSPIQHKS